MLRIVFFVCFLGALYSDAATLTFTAFTVTPYSNAYSTGGGLCAKIIKKAFERVNVDVTYVYHHFKESMREVENGQAVGFFPIFETPFVSKDKFIFSDPIVTFRLFPYQRKVSAYAAQITGEATAPDPNKKLKVCIPDVYTQVPGIDDYVASHQYEKSSRGTAEECFIDLQLRKVDLVVDDELNMQSVGGLVFSSPDLLEKAQEQTIYEGGYSIAVGKNMEGASNVVEAFNRGLEDIKSTGDYEGLLRSATITGAINV